MKELKDFPGYFVTEDGRVFSYFLPGTRGILDYNCIPRELKPSSRKGYQRIKIKGKNISIHRLVAETYLSNPDNLPQVNHIDKNRRNNHISNLEWCSQQYNIEHSQAKTYIIENIHTKEQFEVFNLNKWCRENNLSSQNLYNTKGSSPRMLQSKGFRIVNYFL